MSRLTFVLLGIAASSTLAGCGDETGGSGGATASSSSSSASSAASGGGGGSSSASTSGAGGGAGGATGAGGGKQGASDACKACYPTAFPQGSACESSIQACDADKACDTWKNCSETCFAEDDSVACYAACDADHPHDALLSDPLFACLCPPCGDVCTNACAGH